MTSQPLPTSTGDDDIVSTAVTEGGTISTPTRPRVNGVPSGIQPDYVIDSSPGRFSMNPISSADTSGRVYAYAERPTGDPSDPATGLSQPENDPKLTEKKIKQMSSIEQAKDRAQITAATAMSIIQVALLKDVIDAGPTGNKYYYWSLGFILTALILQVLAGFVALYIALLRFYYTEYKDDFVDDCLKSICPWRCRRVQHANNVNDWINKPYVLKHKSKKKCPSNNNTEVTVEEDVCDSDPVTTGCCGPYDCTASRFADFEYEVLDMYDNLEGEVIKANLQVANFDNELKWLIDKVTRLNNEVQKYEALDETDEVNNNAYLQKIKDDLKEAQEKRADLEEKNRYAKQLRAQKTILKHDVERIEEERVLKRATFWQNWLNMILYTVFVLNAIIAGIGLANPQTQIFVVSPTEAPLNRTPTG